MKHLKLTLLLTVLMSMVGARAMADEFTVDGISYYNYDGDEVVLTSGSSCSGDVVIPETVTYNDVTYRVLCIGPGAFSNCSGLTSITIPNSVTAIANEAFYNCDALTSITIPNSVQTIDYSAFENCSGLTSVNIGNGVEYIEHSAFSYCSNLTSITIPNSVVFIGNYAFQGCEKLKTITIPNSVTTIGSYAFENCENLESITIPNSVTTIDEGTFCNCRNLMSVTIPNSVTTIGDYAFERCRLTSINIPNSVTSIGNGAFYYNYELTSIVVEAGNTVYDSRNNCNAIIEKNSNKLIQGCVNTIIPNNVTSIGDYAFYGFYDLESITIPNSVTSIGDNAFSDCSSLTSVTIPNSVTSIGDYAFYDCSGLTSIIIPNSVTSIGQDAFDYTAWYNNQPDGLIYAGKVVYKYKGTMPANTNIILDEGTLGIAGRAFSSCQRLTSITIPNSVINIGENAFSYCSGLTSVTIPNSVTSIGNYAFNGCSSLTSVTVENTVPISIDFGTFSNRANATLYVPYGSKAAYEAANYWKQFKEIVGVERFFFEGTTVRCGSQSVIPVLFESEAAYGGLQCEVTLPAGITLNKVSKTARLSDAFTLTKSLTGDNTYQILIYNTERATFVGNDGALFTMTVDVADNMAVGNYDVTLSNIVVSDVDNNQTDLRDCTAMLRVENYLLGDANRDNRVNVTDIMAVANKILKYDVPNFNEHAADVNFDNRINVTDIMGIANIILKINTAAHAPAVQLPEPQ